MSCVVSVCVCVCVCMRACLCVFVFVYESYGALGVLIVVIGAPVSLPLILVHSPLSVCFLYFKKPWNDLCGCIFKCVSVCLCVCVCVMQNCRVQRRARRCPRSDV